MHSTKATDDGSIGRILRYVPIVSILSAFGLFVWVVVCGRGLDARVWIVGWGELSQICMN